MKVNGEWEGVLVVDPAGFCVGIRIRRGVEEFLLPFDPSQIEDARPASLWNRIQAITPLDLYDASLMTALVGAPALLLLSRVGLPPLSGVAAACCALSIYFMYQVRGFPLIRPLAAMAAFAQIVIGSIWFVRWALA